MANTLQQMLNDRREKAGKAISDARAIGERIREAEAAGTPVGELAEQFKKAEADAAEAMSALQRTSAEVRLEQDQSSIKVVTDRLAFRATRDINDTVERMDLKGARARRNAERHLRSRQEAFSAAGVTTAADMARFAEAHGDATRAMIADGPVAAMKAFEGHNFKPREAFALVSSQGDLGGFLVSDDMQAEVLRDLPAFTALRPAMRVIPTSGNVVVFPTLQSATSTRASIYSSGFTGSWKSEGYVTGGTAPTVQNQPRFGQARIPVHVWAPDAVELTMELINDNKADLEGMLSELFAETLGLDEEAAFIAGSGIGQPLGLLNTATDTALTAVNSGAAASLTYEGLISLFADLPSQYRRNAKWLMNSLTFGAILKLKDGNGMPIFPVNQMPGTLFGKEILFSEFMPDVEANAFPIIFGDFRYYGIADRQELRVQRLAERYAPNIGLLPTAREGGQILRIDAFRKHKVAA